GLSHEIVAVDRQIDRRDDVVDATGHVLRRVGGDVTRRGDLDELAVDRRAVGDRDDGDLVVLRRSDIVRVRHPAIDLLRDTGCGGYVAAGVRYLLLGDFHPVDVDPGDLVADR